MHIRPFHLSDQPAVIDLWNRCGLSRPWNDPARDIARKLGVRPDWFLVGEQNGKIVASVMAGYEGHRGWINYLAVSPECQRQGQGRLIMEAAEKLLREAGCPKINLQVRSSNSSVIEFYNSIGYLQDDVISLGKRFEKDDEPRTPES